MAAEASGELGAPKTLVNIKLRSSLAEYPSTHLMDTSDGGKMRRSGRNSVGNEGDPAPHCRDLRYSTLDFKKINKHNPKHPRQKIIKLIDACGDRRKEERNRVRVSQEIDMTLDSLHQDNCEFDKNVSEWKQQFKVSCNF